jgi:hypothetical protein
MNQNVVGIPEKEANTEGSCHDDPNDLSFEYKKIYIYEGIRSKI